MNYTVINGDTDSITICKKDYSPFTLEEQEEILNYLNSKMPEYIKFENDGFYTTFIVLAAKNYIMYNNEKIKLKGSSLKSSTLEIAVKEMINEMIKSLVENKSIDYLKEIYLKYVKEGCNIKDMKRWAKKITITSKTISSQRTNEKKIIEALERNNINYSEGDRFYVFFKSNGDLELYDKFDGDYDIDIILNKLYLSTKRFANILPCDEIFKNYKLKKNKKDLESIL